MEFSTKRFLQLAGIRDLPEVTTPASHASPSQPRQLVESAKRTPVESSDEQKLRTLIRSEAQRMLSERITRYTNPDITKIQQKKSLTEAITMGFTGIGFGGKTPALGGPLTSARMTFTNLVSEAEETSEEDKLEELDETDKVEESEDSESQDV